LKVLFDLEHPAHVHVFKNTIRALEEKGHETKIIAKNKDITTDLLDRLGFEYETVSKYYPSMYQKGFGVIDKDIRLLKIARKFKPDVLTGILTPHIAHVGRIIGKPSITFTDTEEVRLGNMLTFPFTDVICTPTCFLKDLGPKHVRFNGYKELAYLHPNHFTPDHSVLEDMGLSDGERFIILRLISWSASHDVGLKGISVESRKEFIKELEKYGRVFISSEGKMPSGLESYQLRCAKEKMHSLMYYAQLYIGEGGTMATESALLGTPAVHIESTSTGIATGSMCGNFLELRDRYGLLYFYPNQRLALDKAVSILENADSKNEWNKKREKMLAEKVDVSSWMTDFIERYPLSKKQGVNQ
jgi:uncharacterized protein